MRASKLTKKQVNAIFNDSVKQAVLPPKIKTDDMKPADPADMLYISQLKNDLAKRLGWKTRGIDLQSQSASETDKVPSKTELCQTGAKGRKLEGVADEEAELDKEFLDSLEEVDYNFENGN